MSGSSRDPIQLLRNAGDIDRTTVTMIDAMVNDYSRQLHDLQTQQEHITRKGYRLFTLTAVVLLLGVSTILWAFVRWHLIKPLNTLFHEPLHAAIRLSEDKFDISIKHSERSGVLAKALVVFKRNRVSELALIRASEQLLQLRIDRLSMGVSAAAQAVTCPIWRRTCVKICI